MSEDTLESLAKERFAALAVLDDIDARISTNKSLTLVRCEKNVNGDGCGQGFEVRELEYIQTHWYVPPRGCTEGGYWKPGEGNWRCPKCGHLNRLYDKPDVESIKHLFLKVVGVYD